MNVSDARLLAAEQPSGARARQTAAYYIVFIVLGLTTASLGPTLPGLAGHLGVALSLMSSLFPIRSLGYLLGSLLSGRLYDRFPAHPIMVAMLAVMGVMMSLVPVLPFLPLLAAAFLVVGLCEGFIDVGGNTLIVWVHRDGVGPYMNALHFFFGVGAFLSPLIIAQVIALTGSFTWAYWIFSILFIPAAVWLARQPTPKSLHPHAPAQTAEKPSDTAAPRPPADPVLIAVITVFFFLYVAGEVSMGGWAYSYATALGLGDPVTSAYLTSAFWGALTFGRLLSIPIAARLRSEQILWMDLIGVGISLAAVILFPASGAALWAGVIGAGLFMASVFPTMLAFAGQRMTITGQATGLFLVGASLGGMSVPWIIGQLFEPVGPAVVMWAIAASVGLALACFGLVWLRSQTVGAWRR